MAKIMPYLTLAISGLGWLTFFIGLYVGKIIEIEVLAAIQLTFLCLFTMTQDQINPCVSQLKGLSYSNGINLFPFI